MLSKNYKYIYPNCNNITLNKKITIYFAFTKVNENRFLLFMKTVILKTGKYLLTVTVCRWM